MSYDSQLRVQPFAAKSGTKKTVLRPKQEQLLHLFRERHILAPLLKAKLIKRVGTRKTGRYVLA